MPLSHMGLGPGAVDGSINARTKEAIAYPSLSFCSSYEPLSALLVQIVDFGILFGKAVRLVRDST